jgi:sulfatase modifying factor 1
MKRRLLGGGPGLALLAASLVLSCNASDEPSSAAAAQQDAAGDALQVDDAGAAGTQDASLADREPETCQSGSNPGPAMVEVHTSTGERYCIDSTEVTEAQYQEFLANVSFQPGTEHPRCADNKEYEPGVWPTYPHDGCDRLFWRPDETPDWPVSCVDWCDAYAYCKWAGKRLCGAIGGGEDTTPEDLSTSQWGYACSQGGVTQYPYGDEFSESTCDGATFAGAEKFDHDCGCFIHSDVGSWIGCHGTTAPWDAIHDMSGSVAEWTDRCQPNGSGCLTRGGSYLDDTPERLACAELTFVYYRMFHPDLGFRCCKDLSP